MANSNRPHMLIDGRNLMYRAIFANHKNNGKRYHHFTVMLRFIHTWLQRFNPSAITVCWDAKKKTLWRKAVYPEYKERDHTKNKLDIRDDLIYTESAARAIFSVLGVRQLDKKKQEADDMIYSACYVLAPLSVVVVSTDKDMHQLPFRMEHVTLFEPQRNIIIQKPMIDPVIAKALAGDDSDTIAGYYGIGPVKSTKLAESSNELLEFFKEQGHSIYIRNRLLMDLSYNPNLIANNFYVSKKLIEPIVFDKKIINDLSHRHRISGLVAEYSNIVAPFKTLVEQTSIESSEPSVEVVEAV